MPYQFTFTQRFQRNYKSLNDQEKKQTLNKLKLLSENPSHPSLRSKRIQGATESFGPMRGMP